VDDSTVIAIGALVIAIFFNGYLIWYNHKVIDEMRITRKAEFLPRLKACLDFPAPTVFFLKIMNVGRGPIIDLKIRIEIIPREPKNDKATDQNRTFSQELMISDEHESFILYPTNSKELRTIYEKAVISGFFKDIYGELHTVKEELFFGSPEEDTQKPAQLFKKDPLEEMNKQMERIKDELRNLNRNLEIIKSDVHDFIKKEDGGEEK
jgi:hypothetical protein